MNLKSLWRIFICIYLNQRNLPECRTMILKEWSVQDCKRAKHKTYTSLDDSRVILTTSKAFHYFRARRNEIRFAVDPP